MSVVRRPPEDEEPKLQTVDRALQILGLFAFPGESLSVSELARRLGLHRSTASRLAATLQSRGFLRRDGADGLELGPELIRLGLIALAGRFRIKTAEAVMHRLAEDVRETVTLAAPVAGAVVTIAHVDGPHFISSSNWIGVHAPPHACSDGKVLLAFGALSRPRPPLERLAHKTITDCDLLEGALDETRRQGFAFADSEFEDGLVGLAVPVREYGRCVAALCVSGPSYRLDYAAAQRLAPLCRDAATEIEREWGGDAIA
jgi:IclR family transcriptional regulator, acetate operon repressor